MGGRVFFFFKQAPEQMNWSRAKGEKRLRPQDGGRIIMAKCSELPKSQEYGELRIDGARMKTLIGFF